jgi:osmotically-inducible protein OsmY
MAKCDLITHKKEPHMKTDTELQQNVLDELEWQPGLDARAIGVSVDRGVVTLTGQVASLAQKWEAEDVAKHVAGVRAIANDIKVDLGSGARTDAEIARAALNVLEWDVVVPDKRLTVTVSDGWVKLEGEADWQYQRAAAERAVRYLSGVTGVTNQLAIKAAVTPKEIKTKIEQALARSAALHAQQINVETHGHTVILRGNVRTWEEREDAERAAWAAPGVTTVDNHILVG